MRERQVPRVMVEVVVHTQVLGGRQGMVEATCRLITLVTPERDRLVVGVGIRQVAAVRIRIGARNELSHQIDCHRIHAGRGYLNGATGASGKDAAVRSSHRRADAAAAVQHIGHGLTGDRASNCRGREHTRTLGCSGHGGDVSGEALCHTPAFV